MLTVVLVVFFGCFLFFCMVQQRFGNPPSVSTYAINEPKTKPCDCAKEQNGTAMASAVVLATVLLRARRALVWLQAMAFLALCPSDCRLAPLPPSLTHAHTQTSPINCSSLIFISPMWGSEAFAYPQFTLWKRTLLTLLFLSVSHLFFTCVY